MRSHIILLAAAMCAVFILALSILTGCNVPRVPTTPTEVSPPISSTSEEILPPSSPTPEQTPSSPPEPVVRTVGLLQNKPGVFEGYTLFSCRWYTNTYLIDIDDLEPAHDGVFFTGSHGEWASFNDSAKDQLIGHMQMVHGIKQSYGNGYGSDYFTYDALNRAGVETANKFTWKNSAKELLNGL